MVICAAEISASDNTLIVQCVAEISALKIHLNCILLQTFNVNGEICC